MKTARAVWFERRGEASLRAEQIAEPREGEALIHTLYSGISAGTELKVLLGQVPESARRELTLPLMRGSFDLPISYGYCCVGEVEAVHPSVTSLGVGDRVFCLHPHHDYFNAPQATLRRLPQDLPAQRLVLAANMETAITVVWDAKVELGDVVVVVGLGVVGLLVVRLLRLSGASRVVAVDRLEHRLALAASVGATEVHAGLSASMVAAADVIIEATGSPEPLAMITANAGHGSRVVIASFYGDAPATLSLGGLFHTHRVSLLSSQVGTIPASKRDRWSFDRRFELVRERLHDEALDALLAPAVPLSEASRVYAALASGEPRANVQLVFDART